MLNPFDKENKDIAWCKGCGDFLILDILKTAMFEIGLSPLSTVLVSGIGQAAKLPQYVNCNFFNGLHGRALPVATGIKLANKSLNVIVTSGDGDMYGEGGNHFIHTIRRNPNITMLVHNNMVYGLTKGQPSPTYYSENIEDNNSIIEPFNPISVALALNASFVARVFCQDKEASIKIIKEAILHRGTSIVDIFQPCVTYNKINTYKWFKENTYYIDENYKPDNRQEAFALAIKTDKLPLGIFYKDSSRVIFENNDKNFAKTKEPLYIKSLKPDFHSKLEKLIKTFM